MATPNWFLRCLPGLSIVALLILAECALRILQTAFLSLRHRQGHVTAHNPVVAQCIFVAYSLFLHTLAFLFPIRLCTRVWKASTQIGRAHAYRPKAPAVVVHDEDISEQHGLLSKSSHQVEEGSASADGSDIIHALIIPNYKEDLEVLEDTLKMLASHTQAAQTYDIFLAMEERDPNGSALANTLISSFKRKFRDMQFTTHPGAIAGEVPGKSSNVCWAAQRILEKYSPTQQWEDVLVTVMDSDTHLLTTYFEMVSQRHIINKQGGDILDMSLYFPPIIFDRNAHQVPTMVRVADLMWCGAGLSCYQDKPRRDVVGIPTAVYTVTLPLVDLVGGWDAGPEAIGEDMHMMLKCYFSTNGRMNIESVASPASHCNISSGKSGLRGWLSSHKARYQQGLRHMWGCLDTSYTIYRWRQLKIPSASQASLMDELERRRLELKLSHYKLHGENGPQLTFRNITLLTRIFEAHFLPIHLFLVTVASSIYMSFSEPLVHGRYLRDLLDFTGYMRFMSFIIMLVYFATCYERFHRTCVAVRESELKRANLYEEMQHAISRRGRTNLFGFIDYIIFPIAGSIFGSVPLLHAAFAHFFSSRLDYKVSLKPKRIVTEVVPRILEEGRPFTGRRREEQD